MSEIGPISPARLIQILNGLGIPINAQLAAILAQLDVALSTRASEATIAAILAQLDVALSTRASEATSAAILAKMDDPADPMVVEDTGANTNPRRYEVDNGFRSPVIARAGGVATALWTTATTPARTAGRTTVIYHIEYYNPTAGVVTAWLEIGGTAVTVPIEMGAGESAVIENPAGFKTGDNDINLNASANLVQAMITGLEV